MPAPYEPDRIERLLVVVPNWVGDVVLATPVLAALRGHFASARISFLMRGYVADVVAGAGWHDEQFFWPQQRGLVRELRVWDLSRRLRQARFDLAVLLTNSFRAALVTRLARVPRRVGYARDGRGWLLSDKLKPLRRDGVFVPSPVTDAYAGIAERIGCSVTDRTLRLTISDEQRRAGTNLLRHYGIGEGELYAVLNPGAAFGAAKCWLPERFAELADRVRQEFQLRSVVVGAPGERDLMRAIADRAAGELICCDEPGTTLGSLKLVISGAALLVCNDTGPRHYGNAFGVPTVTIFGPTHQAWTDTAGAREIKIQEQVACGPCQLRRCPIDHRCMTRVSVERVLGGVRTLLQEQTHAAPART